MCQICAIYRRFCAKSVQDVCKVCAMPGRFCASGSAFLPQARLAPRGVPHQAINYHMALPPGGIKPARLPVPDKKGTPRYPAMGRRACLVFLGRSFYLPGRVSRSDDVQGHLDIAACGVRVGANLMRGGDELFSRLPVEAGQGDIMLHLNAKAVGDRANANA